VSHSIRTVGNGGTQQVSVAFRGPNISSAMVPIKQSTIVTSHGAVKLMKKLIPPD